MGKELAVMGCKFKISSTMGSISAVSLQASSQPSQNISVSSKGAYFDKITVAITTAKITAAVPGTTGTGILASGSVDITGTGSNVLEGSKKAVLKGDKGTKTIKFTFTTTSTPPSTTPVPVPVTVEVDDPGQTDVIAL